MEFLVNIPRCDTTNHGNTTSHFCENPAVASFIIDFGEELIKGRHAAGSRRIYC